MNGEKRVTKKTPPQHRLSTSQCERRSTLFFSSSPNSMNESPAVLCAEWTSQCQLLAAIDVKTAHTQPHYLPPHCFSTHKSLTTKWGQNSASNEPRSRSPSLISCLFIWSIDSLQSIFAVNYASLARKSTRGWDKYYTHKKKQLPKQLLKYRQRSAEQERRAWNKVRQLGCMMGEIDDKNVIDSWKVFQRFQFRMWLNKKERDTYRHTQWERIYFHIIILMSLTAWNLTIMDVLGLAGT